MAKKETNKEDKLLEPGILTSNLLEPGAMLKVTDKTKDSAFPPGSLGFVSFIRGIDEDYQDLAKVSTIIIRKGKTGKPRILNGTMCVPVFYIDDKAFDKLLPNDSFRKGYVHVERELPVASNLMELPPLQFLGYAVALSKRIKHMSDQCRHKKWPEAKSHPINVLKRMPDYFEEEPDVYLEKYSGPDFRENFLLEARRMSSSLVRVGIQLDITRAETEINAAEFLLFTNKGEFIPKDAEDKTNEYEFTEDNAMLKRTIDYYKDLRDTIQTLYKNKRKQS